VRLPVALFLFGSLFASPVYAALASTKHGNVPLSQCSVVFEQFSHIQLPADTKAVSHALKDTRWSSRAVAYQQTFLAGWIPLFHNLGPPGGVFVIELSPPISQQNSAYRIYLHIMPNFSREPLTGIRDFLASQAGAQIRMDEYALCYPDSRILHVDPKSRRMWQSP
jgi:hypothetical protein